MLKIKTTDSELLFVYDSGKQNGLFNYSFGNSFLIMFEILSVQFDSFVSTCSHALSVPVERVFSPLSTSFSFSENYLQLA